MIQLTQNQVNEISAENAAKFMGAFPEFYGWPENSILIQSFLESQCGKRYPWDVENFIFSYNFLNDKGLLKPRPPSDEEVAADNQRQQDAYDAQQAAIQREKDEREANDPANIARKKRLELLKLPVEEQRKLPASTLRRLAIDSRVEDLKARGLTLAEVYGRKF